MALAGSATIRRKFRQRFGIATRKVKIRSEIPWVLRLGAWVFVLTLSLVLAAWIYDTGRRFAGYDRFETDREIARLTEALRISESELAGLRAVAHTSDSRLQLEATTQDKLTTQIRALQRENAALREDIALFEGLVAGGSSDAGSRIGRVTIESSGNSGRWHYSVLVINAGGANSRAAQEMRGSLQFELTARQNGKDVTIYLPQAGQAEASKLQFSVKYFRRVDGEFSLPDGAVLKAGEVRLIQDGVVKARQAVSIHGA